MVTIAYTGDGEKASETVAPAGGGAATTTWLLVTAMNPSGYSQTVEERSASGAVLKTYLWGTGLAPLAHRDGSGLLRYSLTDGQGSVRMLTDSAGAVTDTYEYDAYGVEIARTGSSSNRYGYCGYEGVSSVGSTYLRARWYQSGVGRFGVRDTWEGDIETPSTHNLYKYAGQDPINFIDPTGHLFTSKFGRDAHEQIELRYLSLNPTSHVGSTRGLLGTLYKPDILNPITKKYAEIKPMSPSGIAASIIQMGVYDLIFGIGMGYTHELWPQTPQIAYVGAIQIAYFNIDGVIFYTDLVDNIEDYVAITSVVALGAFVKANARVLARTVVGSLARVGAMAITGKVADSSRLGGQFAVASLIAIMAGF